MYEVRVYNRNRDIPCVINEQQTHIHLVAGSPKLIDDEELIDHLRKFHNPSEGRGIEIVEVDLKEKQKSVRSMSLDELRTFAISKGVDFDDSDSRMEIMKRLRGDN